MTKGNLQPGLFFDREKVTLLLNINAQGSAFHDVEKVAKQKGLSRKREFHITLIGSATGEAIIEKISGSDYKINEKTLSKIQELSKKFNWEFSFQKEYYFISKSYSEPGQENERRQSIIQAIELPNLIVFYKKLNQRLGTNFDTPFPHITLFTNSTRKDKKLWGIGLYSEKEFYSLKPVKIK